MSDYGVNVDREGDVIGLWFKPKIVEMDEHAYVFLNVEELRMLATDILLLTEGQ